MAICKVKHNSEICGLPVYVGKSKRFCYWDFIGKTSPVDQIRLAYERQTATPTDFRPSVGAFIECAECQWLIPDFYITGTRIRRCKGCDALKRHELGIKNRFNIDFTIYYSLWQSQAFACAICKNSAKTKMLAVEHDHTTGKIRGLVCEKCNHDLLGGARDRLAVLQSAVSYLENPPASWLYQS